ncbi:hypothetical protein [Candidatus Ruminimicrobiellum ovillum]|uniref:hypothetical protein n=1 Tax=Candidatus Ruminimicrobiellum ovillum TaxID=1947927 RepID=UPI00355976EB
MQKIYFDDSILCLLNLKKGESSFNELKSLVDKEKFQIFINPLDNIQFKTVVEKQLDLLKIEKLNVPSDVLHKKFLNFTNWKKFHYSKEEIFLYKKFDWENNIDENIKGYKFIFFCLTIIESYINKNFYMLEQEKLSKIIKKTNISIDNILELLSIIPKEFAIKSIELKRYLINNINYFLLSLYKEKNSVNLKYLEEFYYDDKYVNFIVDFILNILNKIVKNNNLIGSLRLFSLFDTEQLIYSEYVDIFFYKDIDTYEFLSKENKKIYNKFKNIQQSSEIIEILKEVTNENENSINC